MFKIDINNFINRIFDEWNRPRGLFLAALIIILAVFIIDFDKITLPRIGIALISVIGLLIIWSYSNKIPKNGKDTVGFILALKIGKSVDEEKIKEDFTSNIKRLLGQSNYKYRFNFIEYSRKLSSKINSHTDAREYLRKSRSHFMLYGQFKLRSINGKDHHVLELDGIVSHRPIPEGLNKNFSKEFRELLPKKVLFEIENDLFTFEITSNFLMLVAKYIIGYASYLSGDIEYSQSLFESISESLTNEKATLPSIIKIKKSLPERLINVYLAQTDLILESWNMTKKVSDFENAIPYLNKISALKPNNYPFLLRNAIMHFIVDRNIVEAKKEIHKCRHENHAAWRYSNAFLFAYEGDLDFARKQYLEAFKLQTSVDLSIEVEEFINWVIQEEPDKVHLFYCLGLINYFGKEDLISALHDFRSFLELTPKKHFTEQKKDARDFITKIENNLK